MKFLNGYKTYATMAVMIILALINAWGEFCGGFEITPNWCVSISVPDYVFALLATLGIYTRKVAKP